MIQFFKNLFFGREASNGFINPVLYSRVLFIRNDCPYCRLYKKFIFRLNQQLKIDKRIDIICCTKNDDLDICDNPKIKIFENYFDSYPTLFIDGEKKSGANSVIECLAFFKSRFFYDFYFDQEPEYLPNIQKTTMFNLDCRHRKGRIICH